MHIDNTRSPSLRTVGISQFLVTVLPRDDRILLFDSELLQIASDVSAFVFLWTLPFNTVLLILSAVGVARPVFEFA